MKKATVVLLLCTLALAGCVQPKPTLSKPPAGRPARLAKCPSLPPVCGGGLISQRATPDDINKYIAKFKLTVPLTCRFQQPPRCVSGQKPKCAGDCTP
jgi:hypothetical protein